MDELSSPSTVEGSRPGRGTRRPVWLAAVLGVLAVAATIAGAAVLVAPGVPAPEPSRAAPALAAPSTTATTTAELPAETSARPSVRAAVSQRPGTVRLPEGGTAGLVRRELTEDGTLPIPDSLAEATWWGAELGAERGAALLSGHVNWNGVKGPFEELWRNRPGQEVSVVDTEGGTWVYRITEVVTVDKHDLPSVAERLFGQDGPHRLVLVTCGGDYVGGTDGYEDNRIVTAELVRRP
jgi:hypothetical protein